MITISIVQIEVEKPFDQHFNNLDRGRKALWSPQLQFQGKKAFWLPFIKIQGRKTPWLPSTFKTEIEKPFGHLNYQESFQSSLAIK